MFNRSVTPFSGRVFFALLTCVLLEACASQPPGSRATVPALENLQPYGVEDLDPLGVSEEMLQFIEEQIPAKTESKVTAFTLAYATQDPYLMAFDYDPSITLTADEAFRQKTGNCLSFSGLVIALARAAGLKAWYQEVEVPQQWSHVNETLLVGKHVNAVIQGPYFRHIRAHYVVDVSREDLGEEPRSRKISDNEARAQFYNNLGADALIENELAKAYAYFSRAIEIEPDASYIWSNLGVVLRRNHQTDDAKNAYLAALEVNPREIVALTNLHTLYIEEGNEDAAQLVQSRVERYRRRNPFYLNHLSVEAMEEQRYDKAIRLARNAIKIDETEYRFHLTLARAQLSKGDEEAASISLNQAKQLAPDNRSLSAISLTELAARTDI